MSHCRPCSESTSTRCKCSCGGGLHGAVGAPLYRSLADSYRTTGGFAESIGYVASVRRHAETSRYEDVAVDLLAELIERSPNDAKELYEAVQQVVSEGAWQLLLPATPRGRRVGRKHWLCQILAEVAEMLDQLADLAGAVEDAVCDHCMAAGWGRPRSRAAGAAVGRLVGVSLAPSLAPVAALSMKVRIAAVMFCPDSTKHPALENGCARQLLRALGLPTGAAA
jgi:hypothetical protein